MLGMLDDFTAFAAKKGIELLGTQTTQVLTEEELMLHMPDYDGWIIGDDPATRDVFEAGKKGCLKAAVKWGIGVDNIDFEACKDLAIPITNTPNMFGAEVADVAIGYVLGLARQTYYIDREIRANNAWPKPAGISMEGKTVGIVGFGDIGFHTAKRLAGFNVLVKLYDPYVTGDKGLNHVQRADWPAGLDELDFLIFTCNLTQQNHHMLNTDTINQLQTGAHIVNVARGPLIDEQALITALSSGHLAAVALDVFEQEPLPDDSPLRQMPRCIFGSHNSSNTVEGVRKASEKAIQKIAEFLYDQQ
jgi:D-3-phosphoglycerate dehydrogenase